MKRYIPFVILLVLAAILLVFVGKQKRSAEQVFSRFWCAGGASIAASFAPEGAALSLSDGRELSLPTAVSASGVRYQAGDILFAAKGADAFLEEAGVVTYADCVEGTKTLKGDTATFSDAAGTFSFAFPSAFAVSGGGIGFGPSWSAASDAPGLVLAKVSVPKSFQEGTNFSDARFSVGTSADPLAVAACLAPANGARLEGTAIINGVTYAKLSLSDAGAGNYYETTSYRTLKDSQCYAVEYTVHSTNIGNYPEELGIREFDAKKVQDALEAMAQSFSFAPGKPVSFAGTWIGVEGTTLDIVRSGDSYTLNFVMLDGPVSVAGVPSGEGIAFTRDGQPYVLRHGSGIDTGMKYLTEKEDCVAVGLHEGYCRD